VWGSQTRSFADTAARLSDDHWNSITEGAITDEIQQIIDALGDSDDDQDAPFHRAFDLVFQAQTQ
jgi:hypothetical protein